MNGIIVTDKLHCMGCGKLRLGKVYEHKPKGKELETDRRFIFTCDVKGHETGFIPKLGTKHNQDMVIGMAAMVELTSVRKPGE